MAKHNILIAFLLATAVSFTACNSVRDNVQESSESTKESVINESIPEEDTNSIENYYNEQFLKTAVTEDQSGNYVSTFKLNSGKFRVSDFTYNMDTIMGESLDVESSSGNMEHAYIWHDINRFTGIQEQNTYYADFLKNYSKTSKYLNKYIMIEAPDVIMVIYNDLEHHMIHKFSMPYESYKKNSDAFDRIYGRIAFTKEDADEILTAEMKEYDLLYDKYNKEKEAFAPIAEQQKNFFVEHNIKSDDDLNKYLSTLTPEETEKVEELFKDEAPVEPDKPDGVVAFDGGYFVYSDDFKLFRNNIDSAYYTGYAEEDGINFTYETRRMFLPDGYDYTNKNVLEKLLDGLSIGSGENSEVIELGPFLYQKVVSSVLPSNSITVGEDGQEELVKSNTDNQITYKHYDPLGFVTEIVLKDKEKVAEFESLLANYTEFDYSFKEALNTDNMYEINTDDFKLSLPDSWTERSEDLDAKSYYSPDGSQSLTVFTEEFSDTVDIPSVAYNLLTYQTPGFEVVDKKIEIGANIALLEISNYYTDRLFKTYITANKNKLYMVVYWASPFKYNRFEVDYLADTIVKTIDFTDDFTCTFEYNSSEFDLSDENSYELPVALLENISDIIGSKLAKAQSYGINAYTTILNDMYIYEIREASANTRVQPKNRIEIINYLSQVFAGEKYGTGETAGGKYYLERGGLFIVPTEKGEGTFYIGIEDMDKYPLDVIEKVIDILE